MDRRVSRIRTAAVSLYDCVRLPLAALWGMVLHVCVPAAFRAGRRSIERRLRGKIAGLKQQNDDLLAEIERDRRAHVQDVDAIRDQCRQTIQSAIDDYTNKVRELNRQVAELSNEVEVKKNLIDSLTDVIERNRERVRAEMADASRQTAEAQLAKDKLPVR